MSLSFNFPDEFEYSHTNSFQADSMNHHVFSIGKFLVWVEEKNGCVFSVLPTLRKEIDSWDEESDNNTTEEEYQIHLNDVVVLNIKYLIQIDKELSTILLK